MLLYDEKFRDEIRGWHGYKSDRDDPVFTEGHLAMMARLASRNADARSCSMAEGFTWEESEVAELLKTVYEAGYKHACDCIRRELKSVERMVNYTNGEYWES